MVTRNEEQTICFIPGLGFKASIFQCQAFSKFNITLMDYFHLKDQTLDMLATKLLDQILKPTILVGWSLGGLLAIQMAYLDPDKINKLILLNSQPKLLADPLCPGISHHLANEFLKQAQTDIENLNLKFKRLVNYPNANRSIKDHLEKNFIKLNQTSFISLIKLILSSDLQKKYTHLNQKILHLIGEKDAIIKQDSDYLKPLNAQSKIMVIPKSGHAGFLTHPFLYEKALKEFIYEF